MSRDKTPKGTGTPGDAEEFQVTYEAEVPLTDEEIRSLAMDQANFQGDMERVEMEKAEASAGFNDQLKSLHGAISRIARKVRSGTVQKLIQHKVKMDYEHGTKTITRLDTGETWDNTMTAQEMQKDFLPPIDVPPPEEDGKKKRCSCPIDMEPVSEGETWHCQIHGRMIVVDGKPEPREPELPIAGEGGGSVE